MTTVEPTRRRRHQRHPARWAVEAAGRIGVEPQTAEAMVHGKYPLQKRFAEFVAAAIRLNDRRLLDKLMSDVDAALAGLQDEALTPDLICESQLLDVAEDAAEAKFLANPTPENRRQFAAAVRQQRAGHLRLLLALEAE